MRRSLPPGVRAIGQDMVRWEVMPFLCDPPRRVALVVAACSALFVVTVPSASSAPAFDDQGYVDSTARCTSPGTAVVFGSTAISRVAICRSPDGDYQYRGVRVRDGAKLIAPASRSSDGAFTATNDGIEYMVTPSALVISVGSKVLRDEKMLDFHRPGVTTAPTATTTKPKPTSTTPLPPPLPAEVGGS